MSNHLWLKLGFGLAIMTLAACSGGGDDDDDDDGGGGGSQSIQQKIGGNFASIFDRNANSDPVDPQPGDLPAVSFTTDPIDF